MSKHSFRESVDRRRSYLAKGIYEEQIKIWMEIFSKKQIHLLSTEDMSNNPQNTLQDIFKFLDIPQYEIKKPQKQKANTYEKMKSQTRDRLLDFYKEHNEKFFKIIEKKFEWDL